MNIMKKKQLLLIAKFILIYFENYKCYNTYKNIENLVKFTSEEEKKVKNQEYSGKVVETKKYIKIRHLRDLKYIIENNVDQINNIESIIIQSQNFYDLKIFETKKSFDSLQVLDLKNNNISDISALSSKAFPRLISLSFSINRLSDDSLKKIHNLCEGIKSLQDLILSRNNFTKYELLKGWNKYKNLKKLYIGINRIHPDYKNMKDDSELFDFSNIEELGLTKGIFSEESIGLISKFKLDNVKILYLSGNNLSSLKFINNLNCENLEDIWLEGNNFTDFYCLNKFKKLRIINLTANQIEDISKLENFLKELTDMEKIILYQNKFDLNITRNYDCIEKAKEIKNSKKENIKVIV